MKKQVGQLVLASIGISFFTCAQGSNSLISVPSSYDITTTVDRFEQAVQQKGLSVFNRINHSKNAASVGMTMPASHVIIFGNPKISTKLMQCQPSIAIDLPLKVHIWQDDTQQTWLSYYDPSYMQFNHQVTGCDAVFKKVSMALNGLAIQAAN